MPIIAAILNGIIVFLTLFWEILRDWLFLFLSPIKNIDIIWIVTPIWLSWFFAEFYQEKEGTSFGNAISNGVIPLWVGIDWLRSLFRSLNSGNIGWNAMLWIKLAICIAVLAYGFFIIIEGIRGKKFVKYFGRIREITYVLLVFTPLMYDVVRLEWQYIVGIIIFFPVFYYLIEFIDKMIPDPKAFKEDEEESSTKEAKSQVLKASNPQTSPNQPQQVQPRPLQQNPQIQNQQNPPESRFW
jgi:hypothetical protein